MGRRALLLALAGGALGAMGGCGPRPDPSADLNLSHPGDTLVVRRGKVSLSGRGTPGTGMRVRIDRREVGRIEVPADGRWEGTFPAQTSRGAALSISTDASIGGRTLLERRLRLVPFATGANYVGWEPEAWDSSESDASLAELAGLGANSVTLVVPIYQDDKYAARVRHDFETSARERSVRRAVDQARRVRMSVVVKPLLIPEGAWRGEIEPTDWSAWYASYGDVIAELAEFARDVRVDGFVVGTEMESASSETSQWVDLLGRVRRRYSGEVYYFANFGEYEQVKFWNELDVIGVDAFPPLSANREASVDELVEGWRAYWRRLDGWRQPLNRRVFVGEVGFASYPNTVVSPFSGGGSDLGRVPDVEAQERAYQATVQALQEVSELAGVHWWDWEPSASAGGVGSTSYTPQNKPALRILRDWYKEEAVGRP